MVIYSTPIVSLEYDQVKKLLKQVWTGYATSVQFREAIDETVKFVSENDVAYLLSDTSSQKPVGPNDTKYAASTMPTLFKNGIKAMAFVLPQNVITKLSLSSFAKEQGMPDNVRYFDSNKEAQEWLFTY
jgi:hypothetical protein